MIVTHNGTSHPAADLFPMLQDGELVELANDIAAQGLNQPLTLLTDGTLLDGRNRLAACEMASVDPAFTVYTGTDPVAFVISQNLRTRHLNEGQRAMLAAELLPLIEAEADKGGRPRKDKQPVADLPQVSGGPKRERKSRDKAAKLTGASGRSVSSAKKVKAKAPDLAERVNKGDLALDRAARILRDREAESARVEQAKVDAAALEVKPTVDIRHGDFRQVLHDLTNVDAIITDPPYPREFLPLLDDLAAWADKVLAPDGIMAVLFGQSHLPEVYRRLDGHRPYRWTMCYQTPGAAYASQSARCQAHWKPVLIYGGGPRFDDTISTKGTDAAAKDLHHWGQDYGAFHEIINRLTHPGQTVVDPFMGSGTTLLAAYAQGRNVIGADIDAEHVATSVGRLA